MLQVVKLVLGRRREQQEGTAAAGEQAEGEGEGEEDERVSWQCAIIPTWLELVRMGVAPATSVSLIICLL